jgi:hypothetical protein
MKMEQTECSETLAFKLQTPVTHPEESVRQKRKFRNPGPRLESFHRILNTTNLHIDSQLTIINYIF